MFSLFLSILNIDEVNNISYVLVLLYSCFALAKFIHLPEEGANNKLH